jgi:hypothetical protein
MRRLLAAATAIGILAGCDSLTVVDPPVTWQATLTGSPGWEHVSGTAQVQSAAATANFAATAQIQGDAAGAVRPWHVHQNTCAQGGGIVGADADYPRLTVGAAGTATATAAVPAGMATGAAYHVNVHLSVAEMGTVIACGDLSITSG